MALNQDPIVASLVALSDVHLVSADDPRAQLLINLLARIERVECLVMNGDIFDFCFGASAYHRNKFDFLKLALQRIAAKGTRVIFMQGNHEFSLRDLAWPGIEFCEDLTATFTSSTGEKFAITHGDRVMAPWHYHLYLAFTRSLPFKYCALLVPARFLDRLALYISGKSRSRGMTRHLDVGKVIAAGKRWLKQTGCDFGIMGHFHVAIADDGLFCVESWDAPNALVFRGKEVSRITC